MNPQTAPNATTPWLRGLATAVPEHYVDQSEAAGIAVNFVHKSILRRKLIPTLFRRSGVKKRYSTVLDTSSGDEPIQQSFYPFAETKTECGPSTHERMQKYAVDAAKLAEIVARAALDSAEIAAEEVTHLITVSCTGFHSPGFDFAVIKNLGLPANVARTNVGFMGCHGALNGLRVMKGFLDSNPDTCVMLCAVELCTLHQHYGWDPEQVVANSLFADGAAAIVVRARDLADCIPGDWTLAANGSHIFPDSEHLMGWRVGNHGFEMTLSTSLPSLMKKQLRPWVEEWLGEHGLAIEDVGSWAIHPGGPRILDACEAALDLPPEAIAVSREILSEYGNMSSPTVLFILQRMQQMQSQPPCVMLGFGPGLVAEGAIWQ